MTKDIQTTIEESLAALPKPIQEIIANIKFAEIMEAIQKKYTLPLDKLEDIQVETMIIMLGLDEPENFAENLKKHTGVSGEIAEKIKSDLDKEIFQKIVSELVKLNEEKEEDENLNRDSILQEIENPTPTYPTIKKSDLPAIVAEAPKQTAPVQTNNKSVLEQKLTQTTNIPPKEIEISLKKIPQTKIDPYKEPLN